MTRMNDVRAWLSRAPGVVVDELDDRWATFERATKPIVTVFGAYDTGKSSLIRRILVDAALDIPDWLTISARHETFEVSSVEVDGYVLRDTPGLAVGATDARGERNTAIADDAIALTDVAIVVVTPQLATGELERLKSLVDVGWLTGTLWFVISRFDEAGVEADGDLPGYVELANRKVQELRESLGLDAAVPVHVVSQDYSQLAGSERHVGRDVWELSREWDGMEVLESLLRAIPARPLEDLRNAAAERFWLASARAVLSELEAQLPALTSRADEAELAARQKGRWDDEIGVLDAAARASLKGVLDESVERSVARLDVDRDGLIADLQEELSHWHEAQVRELNRLLQGLQADDESQRSTAEWIELNDVLAGADDDTSANDPDGAPGFLIADIAGAIGPKLVESLHEYVRLSRAPLKKAASVADQTAKGSGILQAAMAAQAALPLVLEAAKMIDEFRLSAASDDAARKEVERQARIVVAEGERIAMAQWSETMRRSREVVEQAFGTHAEVAERVRADADAMASAIKHGSALLGEPRLGAQSTPVDR